jgi:hypothetical protein
VSGVKQAQVRQFLSDLAPGNLLRRAARSQRPYIAIPAVGFLVIRFLRRALSRRGPRPVALKVRPGEKYVVEGKLVTDSKKR